MQQTTTDRAEENVSDWMPTCSSFSNTQPLLDPGVLGHFCALEQHILGEGKGKARQSKQSLGATG